MQSQAAYALEDNKKVVRITIVALSSSVHYLVAVFCGRPVGWLILWCVTVSLSWQCARSSYGVGCFFVDRIVLLLPPYPARPVPRPLCAHHPFLVD